MKLREGHVAAEGGGDDDNKDDSQPPPKVKEDIAEALITENAGDTHLSSKGESTTVAKTMASFEDKAD